MTEFIVTLLTEAQKITGWSEAEVRAFIRCIRADSPDDLADAIPSALAWAAGIETRHSVVELMKTLPAGALEARWNGQEIELRINPDAKVTHRADGSLDIDLPEQSDADH
jgi:hypothetical protein